MKSILFFLAFLSALALAGENLARLPGVSYEVYPGKWKTSLRYDDKLRPLLDKDLDWQTGVRKGVLTDGVAFQDGVTYNYHAAGEEAFLTVVFDLKEKRRVSRVRVTTVENNAGYRVRLVAVAGDGDQFVLREIGETSEFSRKGFTRTAEIPCEKQELRFLSIRVHATGNGWINLSEVEIWED